MNVEPLNQSTMAKTTNRVSIFALAWVLVKNNGLTLSEGLKTSWAHHKLRAAMRDGIVCFRFQKVDGSIRQAYGTLQEGRVPATSESNRKTNPTVSVYYDTEREGWRSYKIANLLVG